jgi:DNA polymerase III subunit epsilon
MRFAAIDFETANDSRDSARAVAVAVVDDGRITESRTWLIRPDPLLFNGMNIAIHGISDDDVRGEPEFSEIWPELLPYIRGRLVIAHNAGFDIGVLSALIKKYRLNHPTLPYFCTRALSKLAYPGRISYSLPVVAECLGIEFDHHVPAEDAIVCAQIALSCCGVLRASSVESALESLQIRPGEVFSGGYQSWRYPSNNPRDLVPADPDIDPSHPFYGKMVVFTGTLQAMVRASAMQAVVNVGGECGLNVSKKTHYLVVGEQDFSKFRSGEKRSKMLKAEQLLTKGAEIEILPEPEFIRLL